jgi:hypothetical protein
LALAPPMIPEKDLVVVLLTFNKMYGSI